MEIEEKQANKTKPNTKKLLGRGKPVTPSEKSSLLTTHRRSLLDKIVAVYKDTQALQSLASNRLLQIPYLSSLPKNLH